MLDNSVNSKNIAKNTLFLYGRMLLSMVVALYTSRVILNALGLDDYGIYNVVGGVVGFFNIISGSLSASISRFIAFELGRGDEKRLSNVFCTSVNIQLIMSVIFILVVEILGVWFLNFKMNIPADRMYAANWVLQCSIVTFVVNLISVPYNATIIAHEKMGAFAYISILSTLLNLGVALLIEISPFDKLIFYALCILGINVLMRIIYGYYCGHHFKECRWRKIFDKFLLKDMFSFAGWNFIGAGTGILIGQGVNIVSNLFFGIAVNAARGIASNVDGVINQFVNNFTMALNPQITKSYAVAENDYMYDLVCKGAKYSYYLMFIMALPIFLETHQILILWLKQIPDYTVAFTRLTILISLSYVLSQTLITSMLATGNIKKYQIIIGSLSFFIFLLSCVFFKIGLPPYWSYVIQLIVFIVELIARMYLLKNMISLSIRKFVKEVLFPISKVSILAFIIPFVLYIMMDETILRLFLEVSICLVSAMSSICLVGLSRKEKNFIMSKVSLYVSKYLKK